MGLFVSSALESPYLQPLVMPWDIDVPQVLSHPLMRGCKGWFPFLSGAGGEIHDIISGHHATINGASWSSDGKGNHLTFVDTHYANHRPFFHNVPEFSVSIWIYLEVQAFREPMDYVGKFASLSDPGITNQFALTNNNRASRELEFTAYPYSGSLVRFRDSSALSPDTWHHVVGVADSNGIHLYLNGNLRGSNLTPSGNWIPASTDNWSIGRAGGTNWLDGKLQDIRYFDRALSADDVSEMYRQPWAPLRTMTSPAMLSLGVAPEPTPSRIQMII